jgi:poly-gamma-glutamate capsule biosynthesis protein CapA/YwtB (metallophosphatase superfamily)
VNPASCGSMQATSCHSVWICGLVVAFVGASYPPIADAQVPALPVYLEESHAGSFYFLAQTLPLNEPHTLVLFDAHSDASAIPKSDAIREAIRKVASVEEREAKLSKWRKQGVIQAYNWMEPLMPSPIAEIVWVPMRKLDEAQRVKLENEAREFLDGHEEALPRDAGAFAQRLRVMDFETWLKESATWPGDKRVVASVDLDYFAASKDESLASEVEEVASSVLRMRGLKALCWALSTPWLKSQAQADALLSAALEQSWSISNADVHWEPFVKAGPDRSMMAKLRQRRGEEIPEFHVVDASLKLRTLILQRWKPGQTSVERARLEEMMNDWRSDSFLPTISMSDRAREPDGSYRIEASEPASIVMDPPPTGARVRWWALRASSDVYRVTDVDFGFASDAPRWIQQRRVLLAEAPAMGMLEAKYLTPVLDATHHCGTAQIFAEVIRDGESRYSNVLILRVRATSSKGLRAAWSEQFGLPYIFGSTWITEGRHSGPETGWGADCANFISAGYRAEGWRVPWGSPKDMRSWLEPWQGPVRADDGCVIHFGSHMAALWEDREPMGQLDDGDLIVHQLERVPAVVALAELKKRRRAPEIMRMRSPAREMRLLLGGDVMLGRRVGEAIRQGYNPMEAIADPITKADLAVVNLECALLPSKLEHDPKAPLAAPCTVAALLRDAGVDLVTLANNHSMDRGADGLGATLDALQSSGLKQAGAGPTADEAGKAVMLEAKGKRFAFISVFDVPQPSTVSADQTQLFTTADPGRVITSITQTRSHADVVIVLPHWGREHTSAPSTEQRALAATWMKAGADLVVGSGPHVVQPLEHALCGSVAWSLGNLVFDGPGPTREWHRGALLEITWDADTMRMVRARMIPVDIANDGKVTLTR